MSAEGVCGIFISVYRCIVSCGCVPHPMPSPVAEAI